jgi:hypothetical protein
MQPPKIKRSLYVYQKEQRCRDAGLRIKINGLTRKRRLIKVKLEDEHIIQILGETHVKSLSLYLNERNEENN